MRRFIAPAAAAAVLVLVIWLLGKPGSGGGADLGKTAPSFELVDLSGRRISLESLRGKVVLIDFWATWCDSCIEEVPELERLFQENKDKDFAFLGLSVDEGDPAAVAKFVSQHGVTYPILFADRKTKRSYRIFGLPTKFLIDPEGVVRRRYLTDTPISAIETDIRSMLQ